MKILSKLCVLVVIIIGLAACSNKNYNANVNETPLEIAKTSFLSQDYETAFTQLEPIANSGDSEAQYALGYLYFYGLGITQDVKLGKNWIRKAAEQEHSSARRALALIHQQEEVFVPKGTEPNTVTDNS